MMQKQQAITLSAALQFDDLIPGQPLPQEARLQFLHEDLHVFFELGLVLQLLALNVLLKSSLFDLTQGFIRQEVSRFLHHLLPELLVDLVQTDIPESGLGDLMLVPLAEQEMENFLGGIGGILEDFPQSGSCPVTVPHHPVLALDVDAVAQTDREVLLEIVEGRRVELDSLRQREVVVLLLGLLLLGLGLLLLHGDWFWVVLGEELVEIVAGIPPLEVGQAAGEQLLAVGIVLQSGILFLEEDVEVIDVVHRKKIIMDCPYSHLLVRSSFILSDREPSRLSCQRLPRPVCAAPSLISIYTLCIGLAFGNGGMKQQTNRNCQEIRWFWGGGLDGGKQGGCWGRA